MDTKELRRRRFLEETFRLLGGALGASRMTFYRVDDEDNLYDFVCSRVPAEFLRAYVREMHRFDPLHVRRLPPGHDPVARMADAVGRVPRQDFEDYLRFQRRFGIVDTLELMFHHDRRIRAGLCVMWSERDSRPAPAVEGLVHDLQRYIQFTLADFIAPAPADRRQEAMVMFHFTRREAEIARLLCSGCTNADIAQCLGIGLATVKTHLLHIFQKAGVESRSGLVGRLAAFG